MLSLKWRKTFIDFWRAGSAIWALYVLLPFFPKYPKTYWPFWPFDAEAVFEVAVFLILPPLAVLLVGMSVISLIARLRGTV